MEEVIVSCSLIKNMQSNVSAPIICIFFLLDFGYM